MSEIIGSGHFSADFTATPCVFACDTCWHGMELRQVKDQAHDGCPACLVGTMKGVSVLKIDAPAPDVRLLCLVCATYAPWGIFHQYSGVSVCVICRDKARAPTSQPRPEEKEPTDTERLDWLQAGCFHLESYDGHNWTSLWEECSIPSLREAIDAARGVPQPEGTPPA